MASSGKKLTQVELEAIIHRIETGEVSDGEIEEVLSDKDEENSSEAESDYSDNVSAESEQESEVDDDNELFTQAKRNIVYGKNKYEWYYTPFFSKNTRTLQKNIVLKLPGPTMLARDTPNEMAAWMLFFDDSMIQSIIDHTNEEIIRQSSKYTSKQRFTGLTNRDEFLALLGILYLSGVLKSNMLSTVEIWSKQFGVSTFRAVMSRKRFEFLINCIRFDSKSTRNLRRSTDKFAAIRDLWTSYTSHCRDNYTPGTNVTIDEQLLSFRGRCPFKVYVPNKPDKYELKIVMACDSKTSYMLDGIPYAGKETRDTSEALPTHYVLKLSESIYGTHRNITTDNWFTSVELADKLLKKDLTIIGTLRNNKPEVPPHFLRSKRDIPSSDFVYPHDKTLVSFSPKEGKTVLLLSSSHITGEVDNDTKKSEIFLDYDSTKGGVDTFDQMCHSKSV